jgi:hypothetical protein
MYLDNVTSKQLTCDSIMNTLFNLHDKAHYYHLQTTSLAQHLMLKELYEALEEHKDAICEYLLGVMASKRFGPRVKDSCPNFSDAVLNQFLDEGFKFSMDLCAYAEEKKLEELCNLSSNLQGSFVKARYLNTLK